MGWAETEGVTGTDVEGFMFGSCLDPGPPNRVRSGLACVYWVAYRTRMSWY